MLSVPCGKLTSFIGEIRLSPFEWFSDRLSCHHNCYQSAKVGDEQAAFILLKELALPFLIGIKGKLPRDAIFVAPFARESGGDNAIPQVLATFCQSIFGGDLDNGIV